MRFLCPKHRQALQHNPGKAIQLWHRTLLQAQDAVRHEDWSDAIGLYGNALDIADLLMESEGFSARSLNRYSHAALEFAYALLHNNISIDELISVVQQRLRSRPLPDPACHLVGVLRSLNRRRSNHFEAHRPRQDSMLSPASVH